MVVRIALEDSGEYIENYALRCGRFIHHHCVFHERYARTAQKDEQLVRFEFHTGKHIVEDRENLDSKYIHIKSMINDYPPSILIEITHENRLRMRLPSLQHTECARHFRQHKCAHRIRAFLQAIDERPADELLLLDVLELRNPLLDQIRQDRHEMLIGFEVQLLDANDEQMPDFVDGLHVLGLLWATGEQMIGQNVLEHDDVEEARVLALHVDNGGAVQHDDRNHAVDLHVVVGIFQRRCDVLVKRLQVTVHFGGDLISFLVILRERDAERIE